MRKLNVVAHQDDTLLFMSPDIVDDITDGFTVQTVVVTDGWSTIAGLDNEAYVRGRNAGLLSAIATMAGVDDPVWTTDRLALDPGTVTRQTLVTAKATQAVVFLAIPEFGHSGGSGAGGCDEQGTSLAALYGSCVTTVTSGDGLTFGRDEVIHALHDLINEFQPDEIRLQDRDPANDFPAFAAHQYAWPDHPDHIAVASFVDDAARLYRDQLDPDVLITPYRGYNIAAETVNVVGDHFDAKVSAFVAYAAHDADGGVQAYDDPASLYSCWLARQCYRGDQA